MYDGKGKQHRGSTAISRRSLIIAALTAALGVYFIVQLDPDAVLNRGIWGITKLEQWTGLLLMVLVLEATRRTVGWPLVIMALVALAYALLGPYLPEAIAHKGYDIWRLVETLSWTTEGILGTPMAASATFVAVFILFGSFLETLGGAKFFLDLSSAVAGHRKGGPAQVAVISSAAMGTISGSATIPLMKSLGYQPAFAGAVEAVASTGGQIMPPVMGAAAFVMAEMIEVQYWKICIAALLPAVLYYVSAAAQVHLRADRLGLEGLSREELPKAGPTLRRGWYLLVPLVTLVVMLVALQWSPMKAGIWTVAITVAVSCLNYYLRERRLPWRELVQALEMGGKTLVPVATACGAAGIANANPMQTGWSAWKLGMAGFIVPFMFVYNRALLLEGQWYELLLATVTSILGVLALAIAVEGWLKRPLGWWRRIAAFVAALLLIVPGWATDLGGLVLMAAVYFTSTMGKGAAKTELGFRTRT